MKKMPLALIAVLILLVVISGMADSEERPDSHVDNPRFPMATDPSPAGFLMVSHMVPFLPVMDEEHFLEDNIEKSESMVLRLEKAILRLENEGNDVSNLKSMIINYADLVSESRKYLDMSNYASSDSERQKYLELSRESIMRANSELKPILDELKKHLSGPVMINDNTLSAEGSGIVIISGDTDLGFSLSEGKFSVVDFDGDLVIDINGDYKKELSPDRRTPRDTHIIMPREMISYVDVTGNISMYGSSYTVAILADRIILNATGYGEAELIGNGTYYLDDCMSEGNENAWMIPIFESD